MSDTPSDVVQVGIFAGLWKLLGIRSQPQIPANQAPDLSLETSFILLPGEKVDEAVPHRISSPKGASYFINDWYLRLDLFVSSLQGRIG